MLDVVLTMMFLRVILSWFMLGEENRIMFFLYSMTEPIVLPVRILLDKLGWFRSIPIDMSFFFTYILLSIIRTVL